MKKHLLVVYHSQSGATGQIAEAVCRGARREAGVECRQLEAYAASLADLLWSDGVLFGSPENFGYLSGGLKDFFDRSFYPAQPHQLARPYAAFISAGNDGSGAVRQLEKILQGYPMKKVNDPLILIGEPNQQGLQQAEALGEAFATALQLGVY